MRAGSIADRQRSHPPDAVVAANATVVLTTRKIYGIGNCFCGVYLQICGEVAERLKAAVC